MKSKQVKMNVGSEPRVTAAIERRDGRLRALFVLVSAVVVLKHREEARVSFDWSFTLICVPTESIQCWFHMEKEEEVGELKRQDEVS